MLEQIANLNNTNNPNVDVKTLLEGLTVEQVLAALSPTMANAVMALSTEQKKKELSDRHADALVVYQNASNALESIEGEASKQTPPVHFDGAIFVKCVQEETIAHGKAVFEILASEWMSPQGIAKIVKGHKGNRFNALRAYAASIGKDVKDIVDTGFGKKGEQISEKGKAQAMKLRRKTTD